MEHGFTLKATWQGGLHGDGRIEAGNLKTEVSGPKQLGGPGKGSNPEELLLGASAACYLITLAAVLEKRQLLPSRIELSSEGTVSQEKGLRFTRIVHRPRITLPAGATAEQRQTAKDATERAEKACLISNAIRGNVVVTIEAEFIDG